MFAVVAESATAVPQGKLPSVNSKTFVLILDSIDQLIAKNH
jgi:hypothetical protein